MYKYKIGDFVKVRNRRHVIVRRSLRDSYIVKPIVNDGDRTREGDSYTVHHLVIHPEKQDDSRKSNRFDIANLNKA